MQQYAFQDAKFMAAREKELVLKTWVRFLKYGLRWDDFSDRLYKTPASPLRHAHYNRRGFYDTCRIVGGHGAVSFPIR
jgi:hypothetical protein